MTTLDVQFLQKPKVEDAPGIIWRRQKKGWEARWQARTKLVERGFLPKSERLWFGEWPDEKAAEQICKKSQRLQADLNAFSQSQGTGLGWNRGKSASRDWLNRHRDYAGDDCLLRPFGKSTETGTGTFGFTDESGIKHQLSAQPFMCELAHGPRPSAKHNSYNTCGNRKLSCCNPKHLRWETKSDHTRNFFKVNKIQNSTGSKSRITIEKREEIKDLRARGYSLYKTGLIAGVNKETVRYWDSARVLGGFDKGPITTRREAGILPVRLQKKVYSPKATLRSPAVLYPYISTVLPEHSLLLEINSLVPRGFPGREDVCQDLLLAILEGRTSIDQVRSDRTIISAFKRHATRQNCEGGGYIVSLDAPRLGGGSWYDILEAPNLF